MLEPRLYLFVVALIISSRPLFAGEQGHAQSNPNTEAGKAEIAVGEVTKGAQMIISTEKKQYAPCEPIKIVVVIRNVGTDAFRCPRCLENAQDGGFALRVMDQDGNTMPFTRYGHWLTNLPIAYELPLQLAPSEEVRWELVVNRIFDMTEARTYSFTVRHGIIKNDWFSTDVHSGSLSISVAGDSEPSPPLGKASAQAVKADDLDRAGPLISRLEDQIAQKAKFAAEDTLEDLEKLIPADPRMPILREKVDAVPGPKKELTFDLGEGVKLQLVLIRPGSFLMGSKDKRRMGNEKPAHYVTISNPFYIGKFLVTRDQWKAVLGPAGSDIIDAYGRDKLDVGRRPVDSVSWYDCQEFTAALNAKFTGKNFRLPTEAEWEYACRAGSATDYSFGNNADELDAYAWYDHNANLESHNVGEKKPNAWGLYDMHGNVSEWCQSLDKDYPYANDGREDIGASVGDRIVRGGSFFSNAAGCRSAFRVGFDPRHGSTTIGCRVVLCAEK